MIDQVTIIIRSVGERTEELCKQLILDQGVPEKNLFIIREKPFSKAMRVGYQKGIDNGLKWTYCIDADVLLRKGAVLEMLELAEKQPDEVFTISGRMVDKFFNTDRRVGNHLFRTSSLSSMISHIAPYEKEGIRPETDAKNKLIEKGGVEHKVDGIFGLHDFEQHYEDIARKTFVHANKHVEYLGEFVPYWKDNVVNDDDFKAALLGFSEGLKDFGEVKINDDEFTDLKLSVQNILGKKSTDLDDFEISGEEKINKVIDEYIKMNKFAPSHGYRQIYKLLKSKFKYDLKSLFGKN